MYLCVCVFVFVNLCICICVFVATYAAGASGGSKLDGDVSLMGKLY